MMRVKRCSLSVVVQKRSNKQGCAEMEDGNLLPVRDSDDSLLADLCNEAVVIHGPNWEAIERHISDRLRQMNSGDRARVLQKAQQILNFKAPDRLNDREGS
jgi:hypothetical protein